MDNLDIVDSLSAIVEERNTNEAFFSFYVEGKRLYSEDVTANWRLQIWQDIIQDLDETDNVLFGYGYNNVRDGSSCNLVWLFRDSERDR